MLPVESAVNGSEGKNRVGPNGPVVVVADVGLPRWAADYGCAYSSALYTVLIVVGNIIVSGVIRRDERFHRDF